MGKSKCEEGEGETIAAIYKAARDKFGEDKVDDFFVLPSDLAVGKSVEPAEPRINKDAKSLNSDDIALDIGDQSIETVVKIVEKAGTVVWNGTLGMAELPNFAHGSARLALTLASHPNITSIVGGGDTADFVLNWDAKKGGSFSHVSTGGGASLDLMAGEKLPGVESLLDA
jgi:phosphoglycerate kinase